MYLRYQKKSGMHASYQNTGKRVLISRYYAAFSKKNWTPAINMIIHNIYELFLAERNLINSQLSTTVKVFRSA